MYSFKFLNRQHSTGLTSCINRRFQTRWKVSNVSGQKNPSLLTFSKIKSQSEQLFVLYCKRNNMTEIVHGVNHIYSNTLFTDSTNEPLTWRVLYGTPACASLESCLTNCLQSANTGRCSWQNLTFFKNCDPLSIFMCYFASNVKIEWRKPRPNPNQFALRHARNKSCKSYQDPGPAVYQRHANLKCR